MSPIAAFVSETRSNCNEPTRTLHILEFKISDRSKLLEQRSWPISRPCCLQSRMNRSRPGGNSKPNSVRASFLSPVQERFETDEVCVASSCSGPALFQTILERRSTKLWKKCRLRAENAATRQSQVQPTLPKSPHYWEILSLFIDGEMQAAVSLAERVSAKS